MQGFRTILPLLAALTAGLSAPVSPAFAAGEGGALRDRLLGTFGHERPAPGASAWSHGMHARLRLISPVTGVTAGDGDIEAGIELRLDEGWKTYWRNPGDSGIAPTFDFSASENVESVDIHWPMPERIEAPGDVTFGYHDEVIFPVTVHPEMPGEPVTLVVHAVYGACAELCVAEEATAALALPGLLDRTATPHAASLAMWRDRVPADEGIALTGLTLDNGVLAVAFSAPWDFSDPHLIAEGPPGLRFGAPVVEADGRTLHVRMPLTRTQDDLPADAPLHFTLGDGEKVQAFDASLPLGDNPSN